MRPRHKAAEYDGVSVVHYKYPFMCFNEAAA